MHYVLQKKLVDGEQSSVVTVQAAWPQLFPSLAVIAWCRRSADVAREETACALQALPSNSPAQPALSK